MRRLGARVAVRLWSGGVALLAGSAVASAAPEPPVFPAAAEQVLVDAVVLDRRGQPVTDLTREDLLLAEDGVPQAITSFRPPTSSWVREGTEAGRAAPSIAIVFDDLGLTFAQAVRARKALSAFARSKASRDVVFLATTSGRDRWPRAPAEGPASLGGVVERLSGLDRRGLGSAPMTDAEACLIDVDHDGPTLATVEARYATEGTADGLRAGTRPLVQAEAAATCQRAKSHARRVLEDLRRASEMLTARDGPRVAVLVSGGFPRDDALPELRRLLDSSRRANVALHFLDASSVQGIAPSMTDVELMSGPADEIRLLGASPPGPSAAPRGRDPDRASADGALYVAEQTGGLVVRRTNDVGAGLDRIAADSRARYTLGYVPSRAVEDERYRTITVDLAPRRARARRGWTVRARRGYYPTRKVPAESLAGSAATTPAAAEAVVESRSTSDAGALPLRLRAECLEDAPGEPPRVRCLLTAGVDLRAVALKEEGRRRTARLVATFAVSADGSAEPVRVERTVDLDLVAGSRLLRDRWLALQADTPLARGLHQVTLTVREGDSGRTGAAEVSLDVPPPGVLRVSGRSLSDVLFDDETGRPRAAEHGGRVFSADTAVFLSFDVFGDVVETRTGRPLVTVNTALERPGEDKPSPIQADPLRPGAGGLRGVVRLDLKDARPGEYRIVGRLMNERGTRGIAFEEPFTVVAPERPDARPPLDAPLDAPLAALLDKAGRYVAEYEQAFRNIVADEEYEQRTSSSAAGQPDRRRTRADLVFVRLAGPIPWASFRDVYEVDGSAVRDRTSRLLELFTRPSRSAYDQAEAILAESTRYNIGIERTVNLPTLPLSFLLPQNRRRFAFSWREKARPGEPAEVEFREVSRPTFVRSRKPDSESEAESLRLDLPADGRFWIDSSGVVVRSELRLRTGLSESSATVTTRYRPEPRLAMWVPEEMTERYEIAGPSVPVSMASSWNEFVLDTIARYTNLRRFQVTTDEAARALE